MAKLKDINWDNSITAKCIDEDSFDEYYGTTTLELTSANMLDLALGGVLYVVIESEYSLLIKLK